MLEIQALTYHDLPPIVPVRGILPKAGGTLGRDEGNDLMLPDPMKSVSRRHLRFSPVPKGLYKVSNVSNGNHVFVNDKELDLSKGCVLKEGDKILVGGYVLQVRYVDGKEPEQAPVVAADGADGSEEDDLFSQALEPVSNAEPEAVPEDVSGIDPFAYGNKPVSADPVQVLNESGLELSSFDNSDDIGGLLQAPFAPEARVLKDDDETLDPLAFFGDGSSGNLEGTAPENPLEGLGIATAPPPPVKGSRRPRKKTQPTEPLPASPNSIDIDRFLDGVDPRPAVERMADERKAASKAKKTAGASNKLPPPPLSVLDVAEPATTKPSRRKTPAPEKARAVPSKAKKAAAPPSQEAEALYQAFIEGLGLDGLPGREAMDSDFVRLVGQLFRRYVQGTLDLMASRAVIKQEVRANVTLIAPERNNPLKFSPDATVALMHLLGRRIPGFIGPDEAVEQAFLDLRAHQLGIVSGMQSALNHVLDRFSPDKIGDEKPVQGMFGDVLSLWRKARLWDDYGRYFHKTRESAGDYFQSFFGSAFLEAYEKAISNVLPGEGDGS